MDNILIKDVFEAIIVEKDAAGTVVSTKFFGATDEGSIAQSQPVEEVRGGIDNKIQTFMYGDKEVTFTISSLFNQNSFLAMRMGKEFVKESQSVKKTTTWLHGTDTTPTKAATAELVLDENNNEVTGGTFVDGVKYTMIEDAEAAEAQVLEIKKSDFPKPKEVHLHTIAYNPNTQEVVADIYWIFPKAMPNGDFDKTYNASRNSDSIEFKAHPDANGVHAKYIVVKRK